MNAERKAAESERLRRLVNEPLAQGGALAGLNLCDLYTNWRERAEFLELIQARFPHATSGLDAPAEWAARLAEGGARANYVSAYVGEAGERAARASLAAQGVVAEQAASLTNPGFDLYERAGSGAWQVKSYADADAFLHVARHGPEGASYIVNSEVFDQLRARGVLDALGESGVQVQDGGFLHAAHRALAERATGRMDGAWTGELFDGLLDDWPWVATAVVCANAGLSAYACHRGIKSPLEAAFDTGAAAGRVAAAGAGAQAGAVAGAAVGSAVFPLAGTVIGATVGGVLGSVGAGRIVAAAADRAKWGDWTEACERAARRYGDGLSAALREAARDRLLPGLRLRGFAEGVGPLVPDAERALDPGTPEEPTLAAALVSESAVRVDRALGEIRRVADELHEGLREFVFGFAHRRFPRERGAARREALRMYGALLLESEALEAGLAPEEREAARRLRERVRRYPNHPMRLAASKDAVLRAIAGAMLAGTEA